VTAEVCPSVCPVPDPTSRVEDHRKLEIGTKEAHDTDDPWPHLEVNRSKVKATRPTNAVTENQPYLRNGKTYELQIWYTDGVRWPASPTCAVMSKLKALSGCSSHHLQGTAACCGGVYTGCTACHPPKTAAAAASYPPIHSVYSFNSRVNETTRHLTENSETNNLLQGSTMCTMKQR